MNRFIFALLVSAPLVFAHGQVKSKRYEIITGEKTSSEIRAGSSYIETMTIQRPKANTSAKGLAKINPNLPNLLKDFTKLIESAEVSSRYQELYDRKISLLKAGKYPTEHNFCDCETVLRLKHPTTGKIAFWVQSDMDVVTDGSDGARSPKLEDYDLARSSDWYLPETSYRWVEKGPKNPLLDYYPSAIKELKDFRAEVVKKQEKDKGVVWREVLRTVDSQIYRLNERGMKDYVRSGLSRNRYLVATKDPFVVLPAPWVNKSATWSPHIGDYAAVIYKDKIYPAILGDAGPTDKVGEASLKIARALNSKASGRYRAVSDVTVSYIFFPRSKEARRSAPDYTKWRNRVASLLDGIGGIYRDDSLHRWE